MSSSNSKRLLLIEDDHDQRTILSLVLEGEGFVVETASNGEEGLEKVHEERFDVIVCDYMMPVMNGEDFLRKFREKESNTPVLMLTSVATPSSTDAFLKAGATAHCPKTGSSAELSKTIAELMAHMPAG